MQFLSAGLHSLSHFSRAAIQRRVTITRLILSDSIVQDIKLINGDGTSATNSERIFHNALTEHDLYLAKDHRTAPLIAELAPRVKRRQVEHFPERIVPREPAFGTTHFTELTMRGFDRICRVNHFTHLGRELETGKNQLTKTARSLILGTMPTFYPSVIRNSWLGRHLHAPMVQTVSMGGWSRLIVAAGHAHSRGRLYQNLSLKNVERARTVVDSQRNSFTGGPMFVRVVLGLLLALPGWVRADNPECHVLVSIGLRNNVFEEIKKMGDLERTQMMQIHDNAADAAMKGFVKFYKSTHPEIVKTVRLGVGLYNFICATPKQASEARHTILSGCQLLLSETQFQVSTEANELIWGLPNPVQ